jgi:hypothetical protein
MRIEKFQKKQLVSGGLRAWLRCFVLAPLTLPDILGEVFGRRRRYLLILGHMRAGSSMLTNVIAASAEACGYGETFTAYRSPRSFRMMVARLRLAALMSGKFRLSGRIAVDKALHDKLTPSIDAIDHPDAQFVFLIRDGVRSVQSMIHEFEISEQDAAEYYVRRVSRLAEIASLLRERERACLVITFEELTTSRDRALDRLSRFMGLSRPLSPSFKAARGADRPGAGDPSGRVHAGEVLQTQRKLQVELTAGFRGLSHGASRAAGSMP